MTVEQSPEDLPARRATDAGLPAPRATDAERRTAAALIQAAHADGRLDLTELDERLAAAYSSRTRTELAAITADLSPVAHGSSRDHLVLRSKGSTLKREGVWQVPPHIVVNSEHGSVVLDFSSAVLRSPEVLLEVDTKHGSVRIIVPPGWSIDLDDVVSEWGRVQNKAVPPLPGMPRLRVSGRTEHAGLTVRHPRRRWWWPFGARR